MGWGLGDGRDGGMGKEGACMKEERGDAGWDSLQKQRGKDSTPHFKA